MARHRHICRLVGSFVNIPRLPIAEALTAAAAVVYVVNMIVLRHTGCFKIEVPGFIDRVYQQVWPNWFSIIHHHCILRFAIARVTLSSTS